MTTLFEALVKYARDNELLEKPYHAPARFLWQLDLNPDGSLASRELTPLSTQREVRGEDQGGTRTGRHGAAHDPNERCFPDARSRRHRLRPGLGPGRAGSR